MAKTLKQQIIKIIKQHYGEELVKYRGHDGYESIEAFVKALAHTIKPWDERPIGCACEIVEYDGHPSPIDIERGKRIRSLRLKKGVSLEMLAARMGVHSNYLDELEQGKFTPHVNTVDIVVRALQASHEDEMFLTQDLDEETETEAWIRYTISLYFGRSLWAFHPEVDYEESLTPFVQALAGLDKSGQQTDSAKPILPSLGDMIEIEEMKRKNLPDPVTKSVTKKF